jgi:ribosome-binding protein aMBF1 (putative translation factor)
LVKSGLGTRFADTHSVRRPLVTGEHPTKHQGAALRSERPSDVQSRDTTQQEPGPSSSARHPFGYDRETWQEPPSRPPPRRRVRSPISFPSREYRLTRHALSTDGGQIKSNEADGVNTAGVSFGQRLRLARTRKGLSGAALGALINPEDPITRQNVSHWETDRHTPSLTQFAQLCELLDVSADWLLLGEPAVRVGSLPWTLMGSRHVPPPPRERPKPDPGPRRAISRQAFNKRVPPPKKK